MKLFPKICLGCTEETGRSIGCHATCKRYLDGRAEYEAQVGEIRRKLMAENEALEVEFTCRNKIRRRLHGKV